MPRWPSARSKIWIWSEAMKKNLQAAALPFLVSFAVGLVASSALSGRTFEVLLSLAALAGGVVIGLLASALGHLVLATIRKIGGSGEN